MSKGDRYLSSMLLAGTALTAVPALAGDLPGGAHVVHGQVAIASPSPGAMTIRQGSPDAIVNWRDFSIGQGARVDIRQPSARAALLNRVTGDTPSTIAGQLKANGQVFLVNPNGIVIGPSGTVNAGSFVASTLDTSDEDFLAGRRTFTGGGASAAVVNRGRIAVARHGVAALLGGRVENSGTIEANLGRVGLASGEQVTLDFTGDGFLKVAVPTADDGNAAPLVEMSGRISADGGRVEISAAAARDAARRTVNLSGVVEARTVGGRSGDVILGGGGGAVTVSGRIDARAPVSAALATAEPPARRPKGGSITVTGETVALAGATLDASGDGGGGNIRVGGDWHGGGALPTARATSVDATTTVAADALGTGDGGQVVVWSDDSTAFAGGLVARGGPQGGAGGAAEVSGKHLAFGGTADLSATAGARGSLLLDPYNLFVTDGDSRGIEQEGQFISPTENDSVISNATLQLLLANEFITLTTDTEGGGQPGDIVIAAPIEWKSGTSLILNAAGNINIAADITAPDGELQLFSNGTISATGGISLAGFDLGSGSWVQTNAASAPFTVTDSFDYNGGSFLRVEGGAGTDVSPWRIVDVYGLAGVNSSPDYLSASYVLNNNIDAKVTAGWSSEDTGQGFTPIGLVGTEADKAFTGSLDGQGFAIDELTVSQPGGAGLFALLGTAAKLSNVNLTNATVTGGGLAGGLAARNLGEITGSSVSGTVSGSDIEDSETPSDTLVGGLVGDNQGAISISFSTADTSFTGSDSGAATGYAGGLVGSNTGTITDAYAEGDVTAVSGGNFAGAGGLVGLNAGSILRASASGAVAAASSETGAAAGGLVGANSGLITQAYAEGTVSLAGNGGAAGGLVGANTGSISQTYAAGLVTGAEGDDLGGLVGLNSAEGDASADASFWNIDTTGRDVSGVGDGAKGLDDDEFQSPVFVTDAEAVGWDFATTWSPPTDGLYSELYAIDPVVSVTVPDTTRAFGQANPAFAYTLSGGPNVYLFGPKGDNLGIPLDSGTTARSPVGDYTIFPVGNFATSDLGQDYRVLSDGGTLTVTPATLTITADDQHKTYGDAFTFRNTEFTQTGLVAGDTISGVILASDGAAATAGAGAHAITASGAAVTGAENYRITYADGALSVSRRPLKLTADNQVKTSGNTFRFNGTEFTADGLVNGDEVGRVSLSSLGQPASAGPGVYDIDIGAADAAILANYEVAYVGGDMFVVPSSLPGAPNGTFVGGPIIPPEESDPEQLTDAFTLPKPPDTIVLAALPGAGGTAAAGGQIPRAAVDSQQGAKEMLAYLEQASTDLDRTLADCRAARPETLDYLACVDSSLRAYAGDIGKRVVDLPEPLRRVSAIIDNASRSISESRARAAARIARAGSADEIRAIERQAAAEARDAIQGAVGEIRKRIELIRADDPAVASVQARQGEAIAAALGKVDAGLVRAVEL